MNNHALPQPSEREVAEAASRIVEAFAATDTERYFSGFATDASFIFHSEQSRLESRAAYEAMWSEWVASGWTVIACDSSNQQVTVFAGGAVFSHDVATTVRTSDGEESYRERETIVFRCEPDGALLAVHEHLSPSPARTA
ncbi:YybH family protein [Arthrobacter sp.]|uniref:YybH family protein n=1 Tax=Arthrobacter sp. TaxID=1667 RepID=UPI002810A7DE|nr:nuclear transport factor 2 family protein [Arthrobacter sp.]